MKTFFTLAIVFLGFTFFHLEANASINQAPPNFNYKNAKAVYIDITSAHYSLSYDLNSEIATVESKINFTMPESGYAIYDLVATPKMEMLDGTPLISETIKDPDSISKMRVLPTLIEKGNHELIVKHVLEEGVSFKNAGVASAFWMSDLDDRQYLEQYLPSNLEFDSFPMVFHVEILNGSGKPHKVRANGTVVSLGENRFDIEFPAFYTTSSVYFHLLPENAVPSKEFTITSIDGRILPVEIYTTRGIQSYVDEVQKVIKELENDYGPFPHSKIIVYGSGMGGMEYSGATMTELRAVGHELFHSYNARAVMPANGNSGWMDEALSSWRDINYTLRSSPGGKTEMAGHSVYTRETDRDAYTRGRDFISWIANRFNKDGKDFKAFLKGYFNKNFYSTVTTDYFKSEIENYSGYQLTSEFNDYIYGKTFQNNENLSSLNEMNKTTLFNKARKSRVKMDSPFHPRLTKAQLKSLLWPQ